MLVGPMIRSPFCRACETSDVMSSPAPSAEVTTTAPRTRLAMHCSIVDLSEPIGTAMIASPTSSGISVTEANACTPPTVA